MPTDSDALQAMRLPQEADVTAPDGSYIRVLAQTSRGSMVHCALPPGAVSRAVAHRSVEELWYCVGGQGEVWRALGAREEFTQVSAGASLNIPTGARFQFRNPGHEVLAFVIVTMPPWPGAEEAYAAEGPWRSTLGGGP